MIIKTEFSLTFPFIHWRRERPSETSQYPFPGRTPQGPPPGAPLSAPPVAPLYPLLRPPPGPPGPFDYAPQRKSFSSNSSTRIDELTSGFAACEDKFPRPNSEKATFAYHRFGKFGIWMNRNDAWKLNLEKDAAWLDPTKILEVYAHKEQWCNFQMANDDSFDLEHLRRVAYIPAMEIVEQHVNYLKKEYRGSRCPNYGIEKWQLLSYTGKVVRFEKKTPEGKWLFVAEGNLVAPLDSDEILVLDKETKRFKSHSCSGKDIANVEKRITLVERPKV